MMHLTAVLTAATLAVIAQAKNVEVQVGVGTQLIYAPNDIVADVGDTVTFHYNSKNHSVTQSSFARPCVPIEGGGFSSGFVPATTNDVATFTIMVNNTKPIWFCCAQNGGSKPHCKNGMVGAINAPRSGNTLSAFTALAAQTNSSIPVPGGPVYGVLAFANLTSSTSTGSASSPGNTGSSSSGSGSGNGSSTGSSTTSNPLATATSTPAKGDASAIGANVPTGAFAVLGAALLAFGL